MEDNPFKELGIAINPKAIFQANSNEANQVEVKERIKALAKIIFAGYDLGLCVNSYLVDKGALKDKGRISEIINSFNLYTYVILDNAIDKVSYSTNIKKLIKSFYKDNTEPQKLKEAINNFVIAIEETFLIRDLLISYFENSEDYLTLSSVIGIDLDEDISEE